MHKDRSNGTWPELKAKRHNKFDDTTLEDSKAKHHHLDEETDDIQKIKKDRAAKHLSNVKNLLQNMVAHDNRHASKVTGKGHNNRSENSRIGDISDEDDSI